TLLAGLGLPRAKGVAEPALAGLAEGATVVDYAAMPWRHASAAPVPALAPEQVEQLRALGYVGAAEPSRAAAVTDAPTRTAGSYNNEGLIQRARGRTDEARAAFEHAL